MKNVIVPRFVRQKADVFLLIYVTTKSTQTHVIKPQIKCRTALNVYTTVLVTADSTFPRNCSTYQISSMLVRSSRLKSIPALSIPSKYCPGNIYKNKIFLEHPSLPNITLDMI